MSSVGNPRSAYVAEDGAAWYPWYVVGLLTLIYTSSFIDRTIIALLVAPIRADLHISDTQMSLLTGISFAVFYTVFGLPFARVADQYSRRNLIGFGVGLWSVMTAACGLAHNFLQLFAGRIGVGVGEATLTPSAYSLISDYFPKEKLARAMGVYNTGIGLGTGLALILGGTVIAAVHNYSTLHFPVVGLLRPWQLVLLVVGSPGILLSILMLTVKEPVRRGVRVAADADSKSLKATVSFFVQNRRVLAPLYAAYSLYALVNFGFAAWVPSDLIRTFHWTATETGHRYGVFVLFLGIIGAVVGGIIADTVLRRGDRSAYIKVAMYSGIGVLIFSVAAPLVTQAWLSLLLFGGAVLFNSLWLSVGGGSIALVTPNQFRAQITALMFLFSSLIGFGLGPTMIAMTTDRVFHYDGAVRYSLALAAAVFMPIGIFIFYRHQATFADAVQRAEGAAPIAVPTAQALT